MKILIIGDSFAADWSIKYKNSLGWPNLLAQQHDVLNLAQAGVGEYKIYKQLCSIDVTNFDLVIVTHTSPYRVHSRSHPIHAFDCLHTNADLIYNDIEYHGSRWKNIFNRSLQAARSWFVWHFDAEFQETLYELLVKRIHTMIGSTPCLTVITPVSQVMLQTPSVTILESEMLPNQCNHLSEKSNYKIYQEIQSFIHEFL